MSTNLDPIVAAKLRQFARRRRWLIVARGICAGLVTFLTCLTIAGFVDWYWLLEDSFRYALTAGVYALTAIVVWLTSVRRLMRPLDREEIAAQVELAEPPRTIGEGDRHLSIKVRQHRTHMRAVAFGRGEWAEELKAAKGPLSLSFAPVINSFRGFDRVELHLIDWKDASS